jgi:hypothetical protein
MNKCAIISAILLLFVSACSDNGNEISAQIESQFKASSTAPVNLTLVGPTSWEQVCVLRPYTNNEGAEKVLGFKWDAENKTSIYGSDGVNVLVFVRNHEVIAFTEHPRNMGDFSKLEPRCLTRANAKVVRESGSDGWVYLVASEQGITRHSSGTPNGAP